MAFDKGGATSGAASGASAGMAAGPWGAVVGGVAGGLAGGLMGKKKQKAPDMAAIKNEINSSANRQNEIAANQRTGLAPMTTQYGTDMRGLSDDYQAKMKAAAGEYIQDQATASEGLNRSLSDTLKQNVLSQHQWFGTIVTYSNREGIRIKLRNSDQPCGLPPDPRGLRKADPGTYRLRSTGEEVIDPDYLATWTCTKPRPATQSHNRSTLEGTPPDFGS